MESENLKAGSNTSLFLELAKCKCFVRNKGVVLFTKSSGGVVVKFLVCGARGLRDDSRRFEFRD